MHIYTEKLQPATCWTDIFLNPPRQIGFDPNKMIYTKCCEKLRPAKDCVVQSYYDGLDIWCAPEKGCKDPKVIAEKKAREFNNRSTAQKKRWANKKS
jgi:hypothetical protein